MNTLRNGDKDDVLRGDAEENCFLYCTYDHSRDSLLAEVEGKKDIRYKIL
jgi:hypothetical protein